MKPEREAGAGFLKVELRTGLTFAGIALDARAVGMKEKAARTQLSARTAYDSLLRFKDTVALTAAESDELERGLTSLRERLVQLGEVL